MAQTAFENLPEAPAAESAMPEETNYFSDSFFKEPSATGGGAQPAPAPPRNALNRMRAEDLSARGIPTYRDASGNVAAIRDESGAALTGFQSKAGIAYDAKGEPKQISYDETGPPKLSDPFANIPPKTDLKTGAVEQYGPGGTYKYLGQDPDVTAKLNQQAGDKDLGKEATLLGRKLTLDEHDLVQGTKQQKQLHEDLLNTVGSLRDPKFHGADADTVHSEIDNHFDQQYAAPEANAKSGFFGTGELTPQAQALRTQLDQQKADAHGKADQIYDLNDKLSDLHDSIQTQRQKERANVETMLAHQEGKLGPLDQPAPPDQYADGTPKVGPAGELYPPQEDWQRMLGGKDAVAQVQDQVRAGNIPPAAAPATIAATNDLKDAQQKAEDLKQSDPTLADKYKNVAANLLNGLNNGVGDLIKAMTSDQPFPGGSSDPLNWLPKGVSDLERKAFGKSFGDVLSENATRVSAESAKLVDDRLKGTLAAKVANIAGGLTPYVATAIATRGTSVATPLMASMFYSTGYQSTLADAKAHGASPAAAEGAATTVGVINAVLALPLKAVGAAAEAVFGDTAPKIIQRQIQNAYDAGGAPGVYKILSSMAQYLKEGRAGAYTGKAKEEVGQALENLMGELQKTPAQRMATVAATAAQHAALGAGVQTASNVVKKSYNPDQGTFEGVPEQALLFGGLGAVSEGFKQVADARKAKQALDIISGGKGAGGAQPPALPGPKAPEPPSGGGETPTKGGEKPSEPKPSTQRGISPSTGEGKPAGEPSGEQPRPKGAVAQPDNANAKPAATGAESATATATAEPGSGQPVLTSIKEAEKAFVERGGHADKLEGQQKLEALREKYPAASDRLAAINEHLAPVPSGADETVAVSDKAGRGEADQWKSGAHNSPIADEAINQVAKVPEVQNALKNTPHNAKVEIASRLKPILRRITREDLGFVDGKPPMKAVPLSRRKFDSGDYNQLQHADAFRALVDRAHAILTGAVDQGAHEAVTSPKNELAEPSQAKKEAVTPSKKQAGRPVEGPPKKKLTKLQERAADLAKRLPGIVDVAPAPDVAVITTLLKSPNPSKKALDQAENIIVKHENAAIGKKPVAEPEKKPETTKGEQPAEKPAKPEKPASRPPTPTLEPKAGEPEGGGVVEKGDVVPTAKRPWHEDRVRGHLAKSPAMRGAFARGLTLEEKSIGGGGMAVDIENGTFIVDAEATAAHEARVDAKGGDGELHLELATNEELIHVDTVRALGSGWEKTSKDIYAAQPDIAPLGLWWKGSAPYMMAGEWIRMLVQMRTLGKITEDAFGQDQGGGGYTMAELHQKLAEPQPPIVERAVQKVMNLAPDKGMAQGPKQPPIETKAPETGTKPAKTETKTIDPELDKALDDAFEGLFVRELPKEPKTDEDFANIVQPHKVGVEAGLKLPESAAADVRKEYEAVGKEMLANVKGPRFKALFGQHTYLAGKLEGVLRKGPNYDAYQEQKSKGEAGQKEWLRAAQVTDQKAIPPEKMAAFIGLAQALSKAGIDTPEKLAGVLEDKFQGKARPYSQAIWDALGMVSPELRGTHDFPAIYGKIDEDKKKGKVRTPAENVTLAVKNRLTTGPLSRAELTKLAEGNGLSAKEADEAAEIGIIKRAREIAQAPAPKGTIKPWDPRASESRPLWEERYAQMVELYARQPNLTAKTSTSKVDQAYSTPAPLAYIASQLADIAGGKSIFEPTAGNGMLLIEANPKTQKVWANELDPNRAEALKKQGFGTTTFDAAGMTTKPSDERVDRVIANPPFGRVLTGDQTTKEWPLEGTDDKTHEIDHAISMKALAAMKDDGRAVLLLGGKNKMLSGTDRAQAYAQGDGGKFWKDLYDKYQVVDHFTVAGDLYKKMGAGWPVDVVVIAGRGQSPIQLPWGKAPRILDSWNELGKELGRTDQERIDAGKYDAAKDREEVSGIFDDIRGIVGGAHEKPGRGEHGEPTRSPTKPGGTGGKPAATGRGEPAVDTEGSTPSGAEISGAGAGAVGAGGDEQRPVEQQQRIDPDSFRVPYVPQNDLPSFKIFIPTYLEAPVRESLEKLKEKVGPLDEYVRKALGYPEKAPMAKYYSGEQIDSLAQGVNAIEEQGLGSINGDQGGVGKGRVVAGMMAYADQKGWIPIFVTQDEKLYAEMIKDLHNIGRPDLVPMFTKTGVDFDDEMGGSWKQGKADPLMEQIIADGKLPMGIKSMFTSYAQIGSDRPKGWSKSPEGKAHAKGMAIAVPPGLRMLALQKLAPKALIIADESHLASGESLAGARLHALLGNAKGVYYSSATFAKRPDSMGIYSFTTLSHATTDMHELIDAMKQGGTPLQQVVTNILAGDGLYSRRERDFAGVVFRTHINEDTAERDVKLADNYTSGLREILDISNTMRDTSRKFNAIMSRLGKKFSLKYAPKIESANFSSKLHNLIKQYLFAIKAASVVDRAIAGVKGGEDGFKNAKGEIRPHKVVITFENTMEAPILDLKASNRPLSFNGMLLNYLDKQRVLKVKGTGAGQQEVTTISDTPDPEFEHLSNEQLASILVDEVHTNEEGNRVGNVNEKAAAELFRRILNEAFQEAEEKIKALDLADMPLSPIDYMKRRLEAEGIGTVEMTGREAGIDEDGAIYDIPPSAHTKSAHLKNIRAFNTDSKVKVLLMNAAGSTGISLHASQEFKDQTPRAMLNVQPNLDINKFMQTNWRIDRTGQVHQPYYELIMSALAAEIRPNAILTKKMASLNANTTSNAESEMSKGASGVNIFNQYGDEVVHNYLRADKDFLTLLAMDKILDAKGNLQPLDAIRAMYPSDGEFATKVTGRVGVLPEYEARQFWDKVQSDYDALIDYLNEVGENELTTDTVDLKAETLSSKELTPGRPNPTSGFDGPSNLEKIKADIGMKPLSASEVIEMMGKLNAWNTEQAWQAQATEWKKKELARQIEKVVTWKPEKEAALEQKWRDASETIRNSINMIGSGLHIKTRRGVDGYGAITAVHMDPDHPLLPSKQIFEVHINTTKRKIRIPASQLTDDARLASSDFASVYEATAERSNERYMITGNLLKAYLAIKDSSPTAKIVNYTTQVGEMRQGILMPVKFDPGQLAAKRPIDDANHFKQLLDAGRAVAGAGDVISFVKAPSGAGYVMRVPASKIMGGAYWRDEELQKLMDLSADPQTGKGQFIQRGSAMVGKFSDSAKVYKRLQGLGVSLTYREQTQQLGVAQFNPIKAAKAIYSEDVEPVAKAIGLGAKEAMTILRKVVSPRVGVRAEGTDAVMKMLGKQYEKAYQTDRVLEAWNEAVRKQPRQEQIDFVDRMKKGEAQATPELQNLADTERKIDTDSWEAANAAWKDWYAALGRTMDEPPLKWKEDHFRVLWKEIPGDTEAAKAAWIGKSRNPLRGSMGQHKQSTLDDMSEGIALGGVPYTYNHVEMFKLAQADLWKTTTVLHLLAFMRRNGFMEYVKGAFPKAPDGMVAVDDAAFKRYFPAASGEGLVAAGQYFVEEGMARLLNNYLSRDLVRQVGLGRGLIWLKNATTTMELSLSPFHAIFETLETVGSNIGLGLQKLINRGILGGSAKVTVEGLADMIKAFGTPITHANLGSQFRKALVDPSAFFKTAEGLAMLKKFPNAREAADAIFAAGFKPPELEQDWKNNSIRTFVDAVSDIKAGESDNYIGAGLRAFPAANEMLMKPLFDHYIPNLKVAQFLKEFSEAVAEDEQRYGAQGYYIDRRGKKWYRPYTRAQLARKIWDFVEDRFGEMNYDKIFWNRTFKSAMQLMFRSVTWKGGSVRAFGGAFIGQGKEFVDAFKEGRAPELHRNMAWFFGMMLLTAALGTVMMKSLTGRWPGEGGELATDLVFPQIDPKDNKIRVSLPTYFKDLVHLIKSPTSYVTSSMSGWIGRLADLWRNKDYYGTEIHDNDDPAVKQALSVGKYLGQTLLPFSIRGYKNISASDVGSFRKAMSLMGVQPAPRYIGQTAAEQKAGEYWQGQRSEAGIKPGQLESKLEKRMLVSQLEHGHAPDIAGALAKGTIKPTDVKSVYQRASMGTLASEVLHMPLWEAEKIYQSANLRERASLEAVMAKKRASAARSGRPAFSGF